MDQQRVVPNLKKVETAAQYQIVDPSICPACAKPMKQVMAAGIPSFVCMQDRVCLPRKTGG